MRLGSERGGGGEGRGGEGGGERGGGGAQQMIDWLPAAIRHISAESPETKRGREIDRHGTDRQINS
jgi:hypothetical protein